MVSKVVETEKAVSKLETNKWRLLHVTNFKQDDYHPLKK
jgi:hypothetical protein